ncbi:MAG: L-seryl-tRNA(Sec) selenium transferase [Candidatus Korobacteraceae bacterium]|jgi:L-seryl-tRNA(Ser) seleniumtransferase
MWATSRRDCLLDKEAPAEKKGLIRCGPAYRRIGSDLPSGHPGIQTALASASGNGETILVETVSRSELFRLLPSVDELMRSESLAPLIAAHGRAAVVEACRQALEKLRRSIPREGDENELRLAVAALPRALAEELKAGSRFSLRRVINATGVILHTNLGRAPLGEAALQHALEVAGGYCNLEFDLQTGERGQRDAHVDRLFAALFADATAAARAAPDGAPSTAVVNNNAAAVLLALNTLAEGGEVIVSRGELVEIGGSFRIPDIMAKSGATLREVGTTNRTRIDDYQSAISERTKLLLRVHRSNFKIVGFTEQPSLAELVELGRSRRIPVMEDLGSGALIPLEPMGISGEPTVHFSLGAGVDIATYSGDKLLGGPQAGILSGRPAVIAQVRANPLFRALRVDKLIYSMLESTLLAYVRQQYEAIPALRFMRIPREELLRHAEALAARLRESCHQLQIEVVPCSSLVGGGAAPGWDLPSHGVAIAAQAIGADELLSRLRGNDPPVVARIEEGRVLLDLRTVFPAEDEEIVAALQRIDGNG